jgi:stage IV sporulation protein FB
VPLLRETSRMHHHGHVKFWLFGIPVSVRASFLLIAALLGLQSNRLELLLIWVGVIFVSILVHELGHALTARRFGSEVAIELNGIGGLTSWTIPEGDIGPGRRALIAAAGSATGLVFGGLVWLISIQFAPYSSLVGFTLENLIIVNVFWGLLNWLPIRPLDGGHLFTSLLEKVAPVRGEKIANATFLVTAFLALALAIRYRLIFVGLISGWLVWGELTRGRERQPRASLPQLDFDAPTADPEPEAEISIPVDESGQDPES